MSILQKINTGGFDQNIIDEIRVTGQDLIDVDANELMAQMLNQIEDTLDYDDLKDEVDTLAVNRDRLEDEITDLENKNEELTKQIGALKADAAEAKSYAKAVINSFGKHKVT